MFKRLSALILVLLFVLIPSAFAAEGVALDYFIEDVSGILEEYAIAMEAKVQTETSFMYDIEDEAHVYVNTDNGVVSSVIIMNMPIATYLHGRLQAVIRSNILALDTSLGTDEADAIIEQLHLIDDEPYPTELYEHTYNGIAYKCFPMDEGITFIAYPEN